MAAVMLTACGGTKTKVVQKAELVCDKNMAIYNLIDTPVKFCYDKSWGDPVVIEVKSEVGTAKKLLFGTSSNSKAPQLWISSKDYIPADKAERIINFKALNPSDEAKLKQQVIEAAGYEDKDITAKRTDVSGVEAIRAEIAGTVNSLFYFVRNTYKGHNIIISGGLDISESVDKVALNMVF